MKKRRIYFKKIYEEGYYPISMLIIEPIGKDWEFNFIKIKDLLDYWGVCYSPFGDFGLIIYFMDGILLEKELKECMGDKFVFKEGIFKTRDGIKATLVDVVRLEGDSLLNLKSGCYISDKDYRNIEHYGKKDIYLSDITDDKGILEAIYIAHIRGIVSHALILGDIRGNLDINLVESIKFRVWK